MDEEIKKRLTWIKLYEETGNAGLVCRRCGISRPTLRKWWRRYQEQGESGLSSQSRRPKHSPNQKVFAEQEQWILQLRRDRHLGARRIQHELVRLHDSPLGLATIQKILQKHDVAPLKRKRSAIKDRFPVIVCKWIRSKLIKEFSSIQRLMTVPDFLLSRSTTGVQQQIR